MNIKKASVVGIQLIGSFVLMATPVIDLGVYADTTKSSISESQKSAPITVKYVDQENNEFLTEDTLVGQVGEDIDFRPKMHDDMELINVEGNPKGKYTTEPQQIVYHFKRIPINFPVQYSDENGHALTNANGVAIKPNQTYSYTGYNTDLFPDDLLNVPGWQLDLDKSMYGDSSVNQLMSFRQLLEYTGLPSIYDLPMMLNYQLNSFPIDDTHTYKMPEPIIKPVYKRIPNSTGAITVKYVDAEGKTIIADQTNSGVIGSQYSVSPRNIDGYKLLKVVGSSTGSYSGTGQIVEYVYEKQPIADNQEKNELSNEESNLVNSEKNISGNHSNNSETTIKNNFEQSAGHENVIVTSNNPLQSVGLQNKRVSSQKTINQEMSQEKLPNTGQSESTGITIAGILFVLAGSIVYLVKVPFSKK
ncbi:LPXTG cell wall anchor domain-containing protein [Weissella muntiaci]|uniref:LPXTG cell wall anchor domain-containing protein n=1 Tax=Weissella muntiaci TaxID=2508881 RepID=A0A6C2C9C9_9LACO|nr:MucBP domain-containing protein [Weissella muntiaci]TYC50514.1 LPXTG cell wall anchor domain-containing protein [Weissella muntiaci]